MTGVQTCALPISPTTFTDFGPLREIAAASGLPQSWTVEAHAADLVALLSDDVARGRRLDELQQAIARHTWSDFAGGLAAFFQRVVEMPEVATSAIGADSAAADAAQLSAILSSRTWRAAERLRRLKPGARRG